MVQRYGGWRMAWVALAGCGGATQGSHRVLAAGGAPGTCFRAAPPSGLLVQRMDSLAQQVARNGVHYDGIVAAGFITHGTTVMTPIDVAAGTCVSILAIASPSVPDLDAHVFNADGEIIAEDIAPDPHPTVQLCATEPRRVYHVIETFVGEQTGSEGHGAYAVATFTSDRRGLEVVANAVGGTPGAAVTTSSMGTDAERRLQQLRDGIARRGFQPSGDVTRAPFVAAGSIRLPFTVTPDHCYTLAALADGTVADVDLSVLDANGDEIARDVRPDRDAFVQLCPSVAGALSMEVRARSGQGVVLVQGFSADASAMGGANTLWLGERTSWMAAAAPLPDAEQRTGQTLRAAGFASAGTAVHMRLLPGESREQRWTVEPGHCTAVAAILGRGLGRTELRAYNPQGEFLARGVMQGAASVAVLCPPTREEITLRIRTEVGTGDASLMAFTGAVPAWGAGTDRGAVSESMAVHLAASQSGWRTATPPEKLRLGARALRTREFDLAAGTCSRWTLSTGQGLANVTLTVRGANGVALTEGTGAGTAIATRCAPSAEHVRVEATSDAAASGEFDALLERFSRTEAPSGG